MTREAQDLAVARIEHDRGAVELRRDERLLGRLLEIRVDRQLHAVPFRRQFDADLAHLAAAAVDAHQLVAVLPHQQAVVSELDASLPDDRSGLDPFVLGPREVGLAHFPNVAEQMRGDVARRIVAGRDLLIDDAGQLPLARAEGDHLFSGRILDQHDRPVARLAALAIEDLVETGFVGAGREREDVQRLVDIARLLTHERDVVAIAILDEDFPLAVQQHPARRGQGQFAEMVVLRHLLEPVVLRHLEDPEGNHEQREEAGDGILKRRQPDIERSSIVNRGIGHTS